MPSHPMSEELTGLIRKELGVDPFAVIVVDKDELEGLREEEAYQPGIVVGHAPGVATSEVKEVPVKRYAAFNGPSWICTTQCGSPSPQWALYHPTGHIQCTGVPC